MENLEDLFGFEHFTETMYLITLKFSSTHAQSAEFNFLTSLQSTSPQINIVHYCFHILSTTFISLFYIYALYLTSSLQLQCLTILKPEASSHLTSHVAKYTLFCLVMKLMLMWRQLTLLRHRWSWCMRGWWRGQLRGQTRQPHILPCDPSCTHYTEWRISDYFTILSIQNALQSASTRKLVLFQTLIFPNLVKHSHTLCNLNSAFKTAQSFSLSHASLIQSTTCLPTF